MRGTLRLSTPEARELGLHVSKTHDAEGAARYALHHDAGGLDLEALFLAHDLIGAVLANEAGMPTTDATCKRLFPAPEVDLESGPTPWSSDES